MNQPQAAAQALIQSTPFSDDIERDGRTGKSLSRIVRVEQLAQSPRRRWPGRRSAKKNVVLHPRSSTSPKGGW